jgi:hypothetical protein
MSSLRFSRFLVLLVTSCAVLHLSVVIASAAAGELSEPHERIDAALLDADDECSSTSTSSRSCALNALQLRKGAHRGKSSGGGGAADRTPEADDSIETPLSDDEAVLASTTGTSSAFVSELSARATAAPTGNSSESMMEVASSEDLSSCQMKGFRLYGKVQVVESFPDLEVQVVQGFPDLKVKVVDSFPDSCGKWKFVESFPDFKIKFVNSFPDLKIKLVQSFPGI